MAAEDGELLAEYLSRDQCAHELKITARTLSRWESAGLAPPSVKLGKRRLYRRSSVEAWLHTRERTSGWRRGRHAAAQKAAS